VSTVRYESLVLDRPEFRFSLEPYKGFYFIHQEVRIWNSSVRKETQQIINNLAEIADLRVFVDPENDKLIRYSSLYGFEYSYTETSPHDGKDYFILERT